MSKLPLMSSNPSWQLFSYKVVYDAGTAPNPSGGMCTLGICKPNIRSVAKPGDWIVGLAPAPNDLRIVYCMRVDLKIPWQDYIDLCHGRSAAVPEGFAVADFLGRVPKTKDDAGDCIWDGVHVGHSPRPSHSGHDSGDFEKDVTKGQNVLVGRDFWYFGSGDKHQVRLSEEMRPIIPGRGHKSRANQPYRERFLAEFAAQLGSHGVNKPGRHGSPERPPMQTDEETRARCRRAQFEDDEHDEELDNSSRPQGSL